MIKIFTDTDYELLENDVNSFIRVNTSEYKMIKTLVDTIIKEERIVYTIVLIYDYR